MGEPTAPPTAAPTAPPTAPLAERLDVPEVLRALRRRADVSQRELAARSGVPAATVGHIESGTSRDPRLRTVERMVNAVGARLAILDLDGSEPASIPADIWRDRAHRRFPPHLDPRPETRFRRGRWVDVIGYIRNRWVRDVVRRDETGERRWDLFTEIRRLGPGDTAALRTLRSDAASLDLESRPGPRNGGPPHSDGEAFRYLRDPAVRHWIAEDRGRVCGHLAAQVLRRYAGPPTMVVTDLGMRPEVRDGMVGPLLVAALCDEAERLQVGQILALAASSAVADQLRSLGFSRRPHRPLLLAVRD